MRRIFNGQIVPGKTALPYTERAFLYGDGAFESLFTINGQAPLLPYHHRRLVNVAEYLSIELHPDLSDINNLQTLLLKHSTGQYQRVRIIFWRAQGGRYVPHDNTSHYLIEMSYQSSLSYTQSDSVDHVAAANESYIFKNHHGKLLSAVEYVRASQETQRRKLGDLLLKDTNGHFCESTHSGLLIYHKKKYIAAPEGHAGVPSVSIAWLCDLLKQHKIKVEKQDITPEITRSAESIFLMNATSGLRWVQRYEDRRLSSGPYAILQNIINESINEY